MFSDGKITLNFYSVILGVILISLRVKDVLHQSSPLHKMLIPKIIDDTAFYRVNSYTISQFRTQECKTYKNKERNA